MKYKIRKIMESSVLGRALLKTKRWAEEKYYLHKRAPYIPMMAKYFDSNISIICSNCFAGRIMQDLGMQYNTPTVGLYFWYPDYIEFLSKLKYYLTEVRIEFVEHSKYAIGNERHRRWKHWYPIGLLDGKVEIHFLHYHTKEEAASKWYRRAERVNWNNLFVIGMEQNLCKENHIRYFDKLPFEYKLFFSTKNMPDIESNIFIREFKKRGEIGDPYKDADILYRAFIENISCHIFDNPRR